MISCWNMKDSDRPTFKNIFQILKDIYIKNEETKWPKYSSIIK